MTTRNLFLLGALAGLLTAGVHAQMPSTPMAAQATPQAHGNMQPSPAAHVGVGVVRSIDTKSRVLVIAHQAIAGMGMPAMTMPFRLDDAVAISTIKAGDTIAFVLTSNAQGTVITSLQGVESSSGAGNRAAQAMPGMPEMHSRSGMSMMAHCEEMMKRN